jgi:hypothetical protein
VAVLPAEVKYKDGVIFHVESSQPSTFILKTTLKETILYFVYANSGLLSWYKII